MQIIHSQIFSEVSNFPWRCRNFKKKPSLLTSKQKIREKTSLNYWKIAYEKGIRSTAEIHEKDKIGRTILVLMLPSNFVCMPSESLFHLSEKSQS